MRIFTLDEHGARRTLAQVVPSLKSNELYFNIWHGSRSFGQWSYVFSLNHRYFKPLHARERLELCNDNYILKPILKNNVPVRDTAGNELYCIGITDDNTRKHELLLFWEIPNYNFIDVKYEHGVKASLVGAGSHGKVRGESHFVSPWPVFEIIGKTSLKWYGKDTKGDVYSQHIYVDPFSDEIFTMGEIIKEEHE